MGKEQLKELSLEYIQAARKEYPCDGCGELPILKGSGYMKEVSFSKQDHKFFTHRFCRRCIAAIYAKSAAKGGNTFELETGALKWSRLSAPFRRDWLQFNDLLAQAEKCKDEKIKAAITETAIAFYNEHWGKKD